jgi:hypothetical protein
VFLRDPNGVNIELNYREAVSATTSDAHPARAPA